MLIYIPSLANVRHARIEELSQISELIQEIRNMENIREKQPSHFYYKGKNIIHFHTDNREIFADIGSKRIKIDVPLSAIQIEKIKMEIKTYEREISSAREMPQ